MTRPSGKAFMRRRIAAPVLAAVLALPAAAAQPKGGTARGELLYTTHCVACHNARVHWRDQRLARDWTGLRAQVRRWQAIQKLRWSDADVDEVARYLNTYYYEFPPEPSKSAS